MKRILISFIVFTCILSLVACGTKDMPTQTDIVSCSDYLPQSHTYDKLASASSYKLGDANKDGKITNGDILLLYRYIYSPDQFPLEDGSNPSPFTLSDVDKDGKITNKDILMFYRYIFNSDLYPFEEETEEETTNKTTTPPFLGGGVVM